jgi:hypothetical protein
MLNITAKGSGPALGLHVGAGKAPLTVNSAGQVENLNASLPGGLGAGNFIQGAGDYPRVVPRGWPAVSRGPCSRSPATAP